MLILDIHLIKEIEDKFLDNMKKYLEEGGFKIITLYIDSMTSYKMNFHGNINYVHIVIQFNKYENKFRGCLLDKQDTIKLCEKKQTLNDIINHLNKD